MAARKKPRDTHQPGLDVDAEQKLPDWALDELIACSHGPLLGQWFTRPQWETRRRAQQNMRRAGCQRSRGALDYTLTHEQVEHPQYRGIFGTRAVLATGDSNDH